MECKKIVYALESQGIKVNEDVYLMVQPLAYMTPDASKQGFIDLPEFPFGLEPRICTRYDMARFARESWDMGVRYIGGCCGFQAYHIRNGLVEIQIEKKYQHKVSQFVVKGSNLYYYRKLLPPPFFF